MMTKKITMIGRTLVLLFVLSSYFSAGAQEECTVAVVSGRATRDGRPLLWKNRDSSTRDNSLYYFSGRRYGFVGIINAGDTTQVWMGVNTAGFAIMNSESLDQPGDSLDTEGYFMKVALGRCSSLSDFEALLRETNESGRGTKSNFGCIDIYGQACFYETGNHSFTKIDTRDPAICPNGVLVRANFSMTGSGEKGYGVWRYRRAQRLFDKLVQQDQLGFQTLLQKIARDLASPDVYPYPLPYTSSVNGAPTGFVETQDTINRHRTVSSVVFHGVRPGEAPDLVTMWVILGEPVAGIAIPLWARAGNVPEECGGPGVSRLNKMIQNIESRLYHNRNFPHDLDTFRLASERYPLLSELLSAENEIFKETEAKLHAWHRQRPELTDMQHVEREMVRKAMRALR